MLCWHWGKLCWWSVLSSLYWFNLWPGPEGHWLRLHLDPESRIDHPGTVVSNKNPGFWSRGTQSCVWNLKLWVNQTSNCQKWSHFLLISTVHVSTHVLFFLSISTPAWASRATGILFLWKVGLLGGKWTRDQLKTDHTKPTSCWFLQNEQKLFCCAFLSLGPAVYTSETVREKEHSIHCTFVCVLTPISHSQAPVITQSTFSHWISLPGFLHLLTRAN